MSLNDFKISILFCKRGAFKSEDSIEEDSYLEFSNETDEIKSSLVFLLSIGFFNVFEMKRIEFKLKSDPPKFTEGEISGFLLDVKKILDEIKAIFHGDNVKYFDECNFIFSFLICKLDQPSLHVKFVGWTKDEDNDTCINFMKLAKSCSLETKGVNQVMRFKFEFFFKSCSSGYSCDFYSFETY